MSTLAPGRTVEQRDQALATANRVRTYRAHVKRDVRAGRRSVLELVLEPPPLLESMKVIDLLMALPRVGRYRASRWLGEADASPAKTLGGLSDRQRLALVSVLSGVTGADKARKQVAA